MDRGEEIEKETWTGKLNPAAEEDRCRGEETLQYLRRDRKKELNI